MPVDPVAISRSALDVEWQRMQIVAQNLANANTTGVNGRGSYIPRTLISGSDGGFAAAIGRAQAFAEPRGVKVMKVEARSNPVRRVHDPSHPAADEAGFVSYPNIDHAAEMVTLMRTARTYESNLTALSLAQQMAMRALDIGRR